MLIKMLKRDDSNDTDKHQTYLDNIGRKFVVIMVCLCTYLFCTNGSP